MKLSEKGQQKILDNFANFIHISHVEFESDDFIEVQPKSKEPVVKLSIEEAKGILWDLRDLYKQTYGYEWIKKESWFDEFKKRIECAEKI